MYEKFLANVQMLEGLTKAQRARIIDALEEITFSPGESIIKEGEAGAYLYIIVQAMPLHAVACRYIVRAPTSTLLCWQADRRSLQYQARGSLVALPLPTRCPFVLSPHPSVTCPLPAAYPLCTCQPPIHSTCP